MSLPGSAHPRSIANPRPRRRLASRVAALLVGIFALGLVVAPVAWAWDPNAFSSSDEQELFGLTNQARASAGLRVLKWDPTLASIARWRSQDMIDNNYFSHTLPGGGMVFDVLDQRGYCYTIAGENIGWNTYPDDQATAQIQQMFMNSPAHRANILGDAWNVMGVGAYMGADGKKMWTILFADHCGATPAPTPKPTPKPAPAATPTPQRTQLETPAQTATPAPPPSPSPTATPSPTPTPTPTPTPGGESLQVVEQAAPQGLLETIVGGVAGFFFGP